jgi:hypothetical protein
MKHKHGKTYVCIAGDGAPDAIAIIGQCVKNSGRSVYARPNGAGDIAFNRFHAGGVIKHRLMKHGPFNRWTFGRWSYHLILFPFLALVQGGQREAGG